MPIVADSSDGVEIEHLLFVFRVVVLSVVDVGYDEACLGSSLWSPHGEIDVALEVVALTCTPRQAELEHAGRWLKRYCLHACTSLSA